MLGKLQEMKFKYRFNLMDKDKNGYLERDDFIQEVSTIAALIGLDEESS